MPALSRFTLTLALLVAGMALLTDSPAFADKPEVYSSRGVAIRGTDPVAYFVEGRPVAGKKAHEFEWNGARWRFSNADNLALFAANPEAYAPQYGGYCAWAVSRNYTASTVPEAWKIVDDKLYLNYSIGVQHQWNQDIPGNIRRADRNWPGVLK